MSELKGLNGFRCFSIFFNFAFEFNFQVLFMNKIDLFAEKILYSGRHLRLYQPDFKGTIHYFFFIQSFCLFISVEHNFTLLGL